MNRNFIIIIYAFSIISQTKNVDVTAMPLELFIKAASESISEVLLEYTNDITNYKNIQESFDKLLRIDKQIKGSELIVEFTQGVEDLLKEKTVVLNDIKETAEKSEEDHAYKEKMKTFKYLNMRSIKSTDNISLVLNPMFSKTVKVNMTDSFVQVPTNIYSQKVSVLNTVAWTEALDETFNSSFIKSGGKLLYQYYGDSTGNALVFSSPLYKFGRCHA